jgi:cytidyltransferase-like protein
MKSKAPRGLVHGRFQLFHHGHLAYISTALTACDFLYIGITSPKGPFTEETAARWGARPEDNPFSYEERKAMIELTLAEMAVPSEKFLIIPFPSDYQNIEILVPRDTKFFLTIYDDLGREKLSTLTALGFDTEVLMTLTKDTRGKSGGEIRALLKANDPTWKMYVPQAVVQYIEDHKLLGRLA